LGDAPPIVRGIAADGITDTVVADRLQATARFCADYSGIRARVGASCHDLMLSARSIPKPLPHLADLIAIFLLYFRDLKARDESRHKETELLSLRTSFSA
jgi:hypothetical protein